MASTGTCEWAGASGTKYTYHVYTNPPNFNANQDGNYIYTKLVNGFWIPVYIGEGCLSDRCCDNHHKSKDIAKKGATHVHAHKVSGQSTRRAEERDLLANFPNAYEPVGCNEKIGG